MHSVLFGVGCGNAITHKHDILILNLKINCRTVCMTDTILCSLYTMQVTDNVPI